MQARTLVINGLIAALYFVVTGFVAPFGFLNIQFRLSELFNHLIVLNKKYFFGIVVGVFMANLIFSPTKADIVFGVFHTVLSLAMTIFIARYVKNKLLLMWINTFIFSFNMYIIAYMLRVFADLEEVFVVLWLSLGMSEFITMAISIYIMHFLNKRLKLETLI